MFVVLWCCFCLFVLACYHHCHHHHHHQPLIIIKTIINHYCKSHQPSCCSDDFPSKIKQKIRTSQEAGSVPRAFKLGRSIEHFTLAESDYTVGISVCGKNACVMVKELRTVCGMLISFLGWSSTRQQGSFIYIYMILYHIIYYIIILYYIIIISYYFILFYYIILYYIFFLYYIIL